MTTTFLFLCTLAALLELDTTYAFQTLISRPIIVGPIFGLITGNAAAGLQVGIFTELLFSDSTPLGGIIPPSGVIASVIPVLLYDLGIDLYFGFFFGILSAILYSVFDALLRKTRFTWMVFLEKKITRPVKDMKGVIFTALLLSFLMTFIFISAAAWLSAQIAFIIFPYLTPKILFAFKLAYVAVPWIGLAALLSNFRFKTR